MPTYPSTALPGGGLPAYFLCKYIAWPTLMITRQHDGVPRQPPPTTFLKQVSFWDVRISGYRGWRGLLRRLGKLSGYALFFLRAAWPAIRFRPKIVHVHTVLPLPLGLWVKLVLRVPLCVTIHGSELLTVEASPFWQALLRRADRVFYVSEAMRERLCAFVPGNRLVYSPSGVDLACFSNLGLARQQKVIMVGSLKWQKGYPYALEAFSRFRVDHPEWRLIIIGEGPEGEKLRLLAAQLGLDSSVHWLGRQTQEQVQQHLNTARIFLLTSVSEGFPKALLEAAACGTPVVVTDVGSCREVGEHTGTVVPPKDVAALAAALAHLADDAGFWLQCARTAESLARRYVWQHTADIVVAVYRQLLCERDGYET